MSEWTSDRDYHRRIENLSGFISGTEYANRANRDYFLKLGETVLDSDLSHDVLTGNSGCDWFFFRPLEDRATDLQDEAFANDLDWILLLV